MQWLFAGRALVASDLGNIFTAFYPATPDGPSLGPTGFYWKPSPAHWFQ
jgi:hypothetical protein